MPTLERYRRPRLIVLQPSSTVREAACAMAEHDIKTVLVCEDQALVGILTDRDLLLRTVVAGADPAATPIRDVMSRDVASLDVGADLAEVAQLMRQCGCRRVPITEDGRPVGLVTLDDLVGDGEVGQATRLVVAAQLDAAVEAEAVRSSRPPADRTAVVLDRLEARREEQASAPYRRTA